MDSTNAQELDITRVLKAPREYVWEAWTEAERLNHWWGPKGQIVRTRRLELEPGGIFLYTMQARNSEETWGRFIYREIEAPEKLVFINSFSEPDGNITRAPFSATWPLEVLITITLTETNGQTSLALHAKPINASEEECQTFAKGMDSLRTGFGGTLDQLDNYLSKG